MGLGTGGAPLNIGQLGGSKYCSLNGLVDITVFTGTFVLALRGSQRLCFMVLLKLLRIEL